MQEVSHIDLIARLGYLVVASTLHPMWRNWFSGDKQELGQISTEEPEQISTEEPGQISTEEEELICTWEVCGVY